MAVGYASIDEFWNCGTPLRFVYSAALTRSVEYERIRHIYAQTDVGQLPPRIQSSAEAGEGKKVKKDQ
jgi:hypothetical protein